MWNKWTADHIVRLERPALHEGELLAVVVQIHGALKQVLADPKKV